MGKHDFQKLLDYIWLGEYRDIDHKINLFGCQKVFSRVTHTAPRSTSAYRLLITTASVRGSQNTRAKVRGRGDTFVLRRKLGASEAPKASMAGRLTRGGRFRKRSLTKDPYRERDGKQIPTVYSYSPAERALNVKGI